MSIISINSIRCSTSACSTRNNNNNNNNNSVPVFDYSLTSLSRTELWGTPEINLKGRENNNNNNNNNNDNNNVIVFIP
jgi:hypothetical protein